MAGPIVNLSVIPTGGSVILQMPEYFAPPSGVTTMVLSRAVSGTAGLGGFTTIYSGALLPTFVDVGDMLPTPLLSGAQYVWDVADQRGTTQVGPATPLSSMMAQPDQLSQIMIRLLQGALNCAGGTWPFDAPYVPIQVTTQMPQGGWSAMPFVVVNQDLVQQSEVQIGEDVQNPDSNNNWTLFANAKRVWRVTVFSQDADERDWYRDFMLAAFRVLKATAFTALGFNVTHSFQAASYTDAKEWDGHVPGFYGADLMLELDGVFPTAVLTNYGSIASFNIGITSNGLTDTLLIPAPSGTL